MINTQSLKPANDDLLSNTEQLLVTEVGEYIRFDNCARRFRLKHNNYELTRATLEQPLLEIVFGTSLDPILYEVGKSREQELAQSLQSNDFIALSENANEQNPSPLAWEDLEKKLASLPQGQSAFAREVSISGQIGAFYLHGRIDFVILDRRTETSKIKLVELKASRKEHLFACARN